MENIVPEQGSCKLAGKSLSLAKSDAFFNLGIDLGKSWIDPYFIFTSTCYFPKPNLSVILKTTDGNASVFWNTPMFFHLWWHWTHFHSCCTILETFIGQTNSQPLLWYLFLFNSGPVGLGRRSPVWRRGGRGGMSQLSHLFCSTGQQFLSSTWKNWDKELCAVHDTALHCTVVIVLRGRF